MAASVIKHVNEQKPDVEVHVLENNITPLILQILRGSDIKFRLAPYRGNYTYTTGHLSYPILESRADGYPKKHLIASMIDQVNERTGLGIEYDEECLAKFVGYKPKIDLPEKYVLMVGCGKSIYPGGKEPGFEFFSQVAERIAKRYPVIQVGVAGDPILPSAKEAYIDVKAGELMTLMLGARFFVGLVNGLTHFAGHNGIHCMTFYKGLENPIYTSYPKQHPIMIE